MPTILTRNVTVNECPWLDGDLAEGTQVFIYYGYTYGCISPKGKAISLGSQNALPFVEVPRDALGFVEDEDY